MGRKALFVAYAQFVFLRWQTFGVFIHKSSIVTLLQGEGSAGEESPIAAAARSRRSQNRQ
jgi:hypothetical protein